MSEERTKEDIMAEINALMKMTAEKKGCKVSDLQWKRDEFGHIYIRRRNETA